MPATFKEINAVLEGSEFTDIEKDVIRWQFRLLGEFDLALWRLIALADKNNLRKLALGYPDEVDGFCMWACGDLGARLRKSGLGI